MWSACARWPERPSRQKKCEARRYAGFCAWGCPHVTAINLGRGSPTRLGATYPPTLRNHINAGLLGIAARRDCPFHPQRLPAATRLCCSDPHLTVERCYLLRCPVQSGRSSSAVFPPHAFRPGPCGLHQRRSGVLHKMDYRRVRHPACCSTSRHAASLRSNDQEALAGLLEGKR